MTTDLVDKFREELEQLKTSIEKMIENKIVSFNQVRTNTLAEISPIMGLIQSFEFRTQGNPNSPLYSGIQITEAGIATFKDGAQTGLIQNDGDVLFGSDISAAGTTGFLIFSQDQTYNGESIGAGDVMIGDNSSGKPNILWDKSEGQLSFRSGTTVQGYLSSGGVTQIGAKYNLSGGYSVPTGTSSHTIVGHTSVIYDDAGFIDFGTNTKRITIPAGQGGTYTIGLNYAMDNAGSGYWWRARIRLNGVSTIATQTCSYAEGSFVTANMVEDYPLAAGEYVTAGFMHSAPGSLNVQDGGLFVRKIR